MPTLANVAKALPKSRFSGRVHHFDRVDSTSRVARDLGHAAAPDGTVVVAGEQTAGHGRRQRPWASPAGVGLYVSVLLRPPFAPHEAGVAVQLAAGIAVAESVGDLLPTRPMLRWPNDCYVADRKIAGVLVEAETTGGVFDFLVCGFGVNVNHEPGDFPAELRDRATSLKQQSGHRFSRFDTLAALLGAFDLWESAWRRHGMAPIRQRWLELSPQSRGGRVSVQTEAGLVEGVAEGLNDAGHFRIRCMDGVHDLSVGEVVKLRPA